jgi:hypothetical protein
VANTIQNGKNIPLNVGTGSIPNVSGAMQSWFQPMTFEPVVKSTIGFRVVETGNPINFRGVIQPLEPRRMEIKEEGQQAWTWLQLHSDISLRLNVDDVVLYLGVQTRVMALKDYKIYGYMEYHLVQDWTGAGPQVATP